jgi:hypothetical protein
MTINEISKIVLDVAFEIHKKFRARVIGICV